MEQLARTVEKAIPQVNWFALGEAKRIAQDMRIAVRDYKKTPDATQITRLREVAQQAYDFLNMRATNEAKETADALGRVLKASLQEK